MITHRQNRGDLCHHQSDTIRDIMLAWAALSSMMAGSYWCDAPHDVAAATGRCQGGLLSQMRLSNRPSSVKLQKKPGSRQKSKASWGCATAATRTLAIAYTLCSCFTPSVVSPSQTARKSIVPPILAWTKSVC